MGWWKVDRAYCLFADVRDCDCLDESRRGQGPSGFERDLGECRGADAGEAAGPCEVFAAEARDGVVAGGDGPVIAESLCGSFWLRWLGSAFP